MSSNMKALPVGRILRFCLGALLVVAVWPLFRSAESKRIALFGERPIRKRFFVPVVREPLRR